MSDPIRIVGAVTGGEEVARSFVKKGDRLRVAVVKALRRLGAEGKQRLIAAAPRGDPRHRSPASRKYGQLYRRMGMRVDGASSATMIKLRMRPLPFRALFLEYGWTTAPTRRGNKRRSGGYGPDRKVVIGRKWGPEGKVFAAHQRVTAIKDEYGTVIGRKLRTIEYVKARKSHTYRKTTHIAGRPFFRPVAEWMRAEAQGRIDAAVREALSEPA